MSNLAQLLTLEPDAVVVDKYGGSEFTVAEVASLVISMVEIDTGEDIETFCERFVPKGPTS